MTDLVLNEKKKQELASPSFYTLADVPPEIEWFANITNPNTRQAYELAVREFMAFYKISDPAAFREVNRAHIIKWRDELTASSLAAASIRQRLSALSSLFDYLCDKNAVTHNPVDGVARPKGQSRETPALSGAQTAALLGAPSENTLKGIRDRAILAMLFYHGLRRGELTALKVRDCRYYQRGNRYIVVEGKGSKTRYILAHPTAVELIEMYLAQLEQSGHDVELHNPLFRRVQQKKKTPPYPMNPTSIYRVVKHYAAQTGISAEVIDLCTHSTRTTAATNALDHGADIAQVQEWLGHSNISTTRIYDKRRAKPETSPTRKIDYTD